MTIAVLIGEDRANVAHHMAAALVEGSRRHGLDALGMNVGEYSRAGFAEFAKARHVRLFVSVSGVGLDLDREWNVFNMLSVPVVIVYLDHPVLYWHQVSSGIRKKIITCIGGEDAAFCRRHLGPEVAVHRLAHGAAPGAFAEWKDRDIPLFFAASLNAMPEETRAGWRRQGPVAEGRLNRIVEGYLARPERALSAALADAFAGEGLPPPTPEEMRPYYLAVDFYLRARRRVEVVEALAGLPLLIAGPGWERMTGDNPDMRLLGALPPDEVRRLMGRSRIVLNVANPYHESHERVFDAMAGGAVSLSSTTPYFAETFPADEMARYGWDLDGLAGDTRALLDDDERLQAIAGNGNRAFLAGHTWGHRGLEIARMAGLAPAGARV